MLLFECCRGGPPCPTFYPGAEPMRCPDRAQKFQHEPGRKMAARKREQLEKLACRPLCGNPIIRLRFNKNKARQGVCIHNLPVIKTSGIKSLRSVQTPQTNRKKEKKKKQKRRENSKPRLGYTSPIQHTGKLACQEYPDRPSSRTKKRVISKHRPPRPPFHPPDRARSL